MVARPSLAVRFRTLLIALGLLAAFAGYYIWQRPSPPDESAGIAHAHADLARIAQGLEAFRGEFGSYPIVTEDAFEGGELEISGRRLYAALSGRRDARPVDELLSPPRAEFLDLAPLREGTRPPLRGFVDKFFVDPWGHGYRYFCRAGQEGRQAYELYSLGPDGEAVRGKRGDGRFTKNGRDVNADNLYATEAVPSAMR